MLGAAAAYHVYGPSHLARTWALALLATSCPPPFRSNFGRTTTLHGMHAPASLLTVCLFGMPTRPRPGDAGVVRAAVSLVLPFLCTHRQHLCKLARMLCAGHQSRALQLQGEDEDAELLPQRVQRHGPLQSQLLPAGKQPVCDD